MQTLRQLVVGTDFSECAARALETALTLAHATGARVTVVHVCEPDADGAQLAHGREALAELVARHQHPGLAVAGVIRSGKPWEKLANVAAEVGAGLIVVGRQGRGRKLGEVAGRLVRSSSRSILVVGCDFAERAP